MQNRLWPPVMAFAAFLAVTLAVLILAERRAGGRLVYVQDDPYIHMAIARNLAEHGVWGVTRHGFSSTSSSPLWTLLLAGLFWVSGVGEFIPFALNVIFAGLTLFVAQRYFDWHPRPFRFVLPVLLFVAFATPLPTLAFLGMEHTLHTCLTLAFAERWLRSLEPGAGRRRATFACLALAPLLTAARYEAMFLLAVAGGLALLRRQVAFVAGLAVAGAIPIVVYGAVSVSQGWHFLPNSLLVKATAPSGATLTDIVKALGYTALSRVEQNPHLLFLAIPSACLILAHSAAPRGTRANCAVWLNALFIGTTLLHTQLAAVGWFFRYDAYLVAFGIVAVAYGIAEWPADRLRLEWRPELAPKYLAGAFLVLLVLYPFGFRALWSLKNTPIAAQNIYEQQWQMARFVHEAYDDRVVALNDIGCVSFLSDADVVDLVGLASLEVADLKLERRYTTARIRELVDRRKAALIIVYDDWFEEYGGLPATWIKEGEWSISNNVACGGDTVSFYAANAAAGLELLAKLRAFAPRLPEDVRQSGPYTAATKL